MMKSAEKWNFYIVLFSEIFPQYCLTDFREITVNFFVGVSVFLVRSCHLLYNLVITTQNLPKAEWHILLTRHRTTRFFEVRGFLACVLLVRSTTSWGLWMCYKWADWIARQRVTTHMYIFDTYFLPESLATTQNSGSGGSHRSQWTSCCVLRKPWNICSACFTKEISATLLLAMAGIKFTVLCLNSLVSFSLAHWNETVIQLRNWLYLPSFIRTRDLNI